MWVWHVCTEHISTGTLSDYWFSHCRLRTLEVTGLVALPTELSPVMLQAAKPPSHRHGSCTITVARL